MLEFNKNFAEWFGFFWTECLSCIENKNEDWIKINNAEKHVQCSKTLWQV